MIRNSNKNYIRSDLRISIYTILKYFQAQIFLMWKWFLKKQSLSSSLLVKQILFMPNIYAIRFELRLNALLFIDLRTKLHIVSFWVTLKLFRKSLFTSFSSSKMFLKNIYTKWLFKNVRNAQSFETFFFSKGVQFESEVLFFFIKINGIDTFFSTVR